MSAAPDGPPRLIAPGMVSGPDVYVGVDVGATKIAFGLIDAEGRILGTDRVPSRAESGGALWESLKAGMQRLVSQHEARVLGVGVGSAGPIDIATGTVSPVNIPVWRGFPLLASLRDATGTDLVAMRGDAVALAHAEHRFGAGRGARDMLGLVVSTGIGGGLILNDRVVAGDSGNAGYFGHTVILADGALCVCGRRGCVEAYASGPQMVRHALAAGWKTGPVQDFVLLAESARAGDPIAARAIREGAHALAVAIVNVLATLDIRRVVIGGGASQAGAVYWEPLQLHLRREMAPIGFLTDVQVLPASLGSNSGIIGAALAVMPEP